MVTSAFTEMVDLGAGLGPFATDSAIEPNAIVLAKIVLVYLD